MRRPHKDSGPPSPDLSRTFWKPPFPEGKVFAVKREHPILRWGDYNNSTGLYIWQNERFKSDPKPAHIRKCKRILEGMWYGLENKLRCRRCEEFDRCCTAVVGSLPGTTTCARCRLGPEAGCSFANGGRGNSSAINTIKESSQNQDVEYAEVSNHKASVTRRASPGTYSRSGGAEEQPNYEPPAKRRKGSKTEWRSIHQEESDDEMPIKRLCGRRRVDAGHHGDNIKPQSDNPHPHGITEATGPSNKNRRRTVIEIKSSPPPSPLFCSTAEPPEPDQARSTEAEGPRDDFSMIASATNYIQMQERLRSLEAENYQCQSEKREDRERVLKLEQQISVLREEQDRKLEDKIRELRRGMNYAINQFMMQQPKKAKVER